MSVAEQERTQKKESKLSGWFKTILGGLAGVASGALVMYFSPLLDRVVKPARPVANFAVEQQGLTVTVHNRSTGLSSATGWWDFGDGSALEPFDPNQELITHTYASPGDYTIKLSLRNHIGEENERPVTVRLDRAKDDPPVIDALEAVSVSPGAYAPATFRLSGRVKNAQVCVWDAGDGSPLDIVTSPAEALERLATFSRAGEYVVRLAAVGSGKTTQKSQVIRVAEPPPGTVTAVVSVTEQATEVARQSSSYTFSESFPPDRKEASLAVSKQWSAPRDYQIADVRWKGPDGKLVSLQGKTEVVLDGKVVGAPAARNLRLQLAPDRKSLRVTGELVKDGSGKAPPNLVLPVTVDCEKRTAVKRTVPVMATLQAPGATTVALPPLPPGWTQPQRQLHLELREGDRALWSGGELPRGTAITLRDRRCLLTAHATGDKVRVELR